MVRNLKGKKFGENKKVRNDNTKKDQKYENASGAMNEDKELSSKGSMADYGIDDEFSQQGNAPSDAGSGPNNGIPKEVPTHKRIKTSVEKIKPPTVEEINELRETRNLFHSNLFRLQIKEMLEEIKIKNKYSKLIMTWLEQFNTFLKALESDSDSNDIDINNGVEKFLVKVPLILDQLPQSKVKKVKFQFLKPKEASFLIGSAAINTLIGQQSVVDVAVLMPAKCFQKDNYLNLGYDIKRAIYLAYIAEQMIKSENFANINLDTLRFSHYANNPLKPVLEVSAQAAGSTSKKIIFRIFVVAEENTFKLSRFVPWNNNIRGLCLCGEDEDDSIPLATPNYNAGVLFDLTMKSNQKLLEEVFASRKNFQEGLLLLKVWLKQRELNRGFSGFGSHILAMFICYLYKNHKLNTNMSSYQVARNVWNQLACSLWDENLKGITLANVNGSLHVSQPTIEQFHAHFDVVFIDVTGFCNICANLSLEIYRRIRIEAKIAIETLNNVNLNSFQLIFMTKSPLYAQMDHIIKINNDDILEQVLEIYSSLADRCNFIGNSHPQLLKIITNLLRKGIGHRVHNIIPIEQDNPAWLIQEKPIELKPFLHLGLTLDSENAYEVLDKGPQSFHEDAEKFRKLWGEKAQLRRFQDGTITEAAVWGKYSDPNTKKRLVLQDIVTYLLNYHLQIEKEHVEYIAGQFDVAFKLTPLFKTEFLKTKFPIDQNTDAEALTVKVIQCFDELARKLHNLTDLPLEIVSIGGISPVFRYCDPEPTLPQARYVQNKFQSNKVLWGVIQFGMSAKWPSELEALRALKVAFYIEIARQLAKDPSCLTQVTLDGVLVLMNGYVFGLEIAHEKELALLKQQRNEKGVIIYNDNEASIALEKRHYILPKTTGALHGLYQKYPSFGGTVMIAKRWIYSQLIDDELWPEECTELLIANQYLRTHEKKLPLQPQAGFFRFLHLLAYTDWTTELFVVNFNNEMNEQAISELENRFNTERSLFPPLCIATAYDLNHKGFVWTSKSRPNVNVLARVTLLARHALSIIESTIVSSKEAFVKPAKVFMASNEGYDLVIQLKPDLVPNSLAAEFGSKFIAYSKPNFRQLLVGSNYIRDAVKKLRESYSDYAAFFYNPCGGKEITIIWKPDIFNEREFKVTDVNCSVLNVDGTKIQHKREVLIEDFKIILKDFYLRIDTPEEVFKSSQESNQYNNITQISKSNTHLKTRQILRKSTIADSTEPTKRTKYFKDFRTVMK